MKTSIYEKIIYKFVSYVIVFPIFKLIFRGKLIGRENIHKKESFVIVSNHGSLLDPPFLGHALGIRVSFMAKRELFNIPIISLIINACGAYPVKRGAFDRYTIKIAINKLLTNNVVGIFIDGTRQKDGMVNKPKQGAALISAKSQKVLLPVAIINSHKLLNKRSFVPFFNQIIIKIGKPIQYPLSTSKEDLISTTNSLKDSINNLLIKKI